MGFMWTNGRLWPNMDRSNIPNFGLRNASIAVKYRPELDILVPLPRHGEGLPGSDAGSNFLGDGSFRTTPQTKENANRQSR